MPDPVSSIPNLGPATEARFAKAGITSADEIREMGADAAYLLWLKSGQPPHFIGYYCLVMGLQGRPWNDCRGKEKADLLKKFNALKREAKGSMEKGRADLDAALSFFGVVESRS